MLHNASYVNHKLSFVINLFFKGHMEYAIISLSVGEKILSWLFHVFPSLPLNQRGIEQPAGIVVFFY